MPTLTFNMDQTVRYRGRKKSEVRKILAYADRHGAREASQKFDVSYSTVSRWCGQAGIDPRGHAQSTLSRVRRARGFNTQKELAEAAGTYRRLISDIESGQARALTRETAHRIAEVLDADMEEIFSQYLSDS